MTDLTTDALKRLAAEITSGPWRVGPVDDTRVEDADGNEVAQIDGDYNAPDTWPLMEANARAIALVPALLRELIERREAVPEATTPTVQDAVPVDDELDEAWKDGFNAGFGEAKLTTNPPQPSVSVAEALGRLMKMAEQLDANATNAERMMELLQPEFDAFKARVGHNVYVVRDYVDHRNAAKRQRQEAADIRELLSHRRSTPADDLRAEKAEAERDDIRAAILAEMEKLK